MSVSALELPTLAEIRAERARRQAAEAARDSEARLEAERAQKLDHEAEKRRCGADADGIIYWFNHYVWTYDPRLVGQIDPTTGERMSPYVRFKLWPKQEEFIRWLHARVEAREEWLCEKSRDVGASFLCMGYALNRWLFSDGFKATFGSRKAELVDKSDQPDSLFEKARIMLRRLPEWMLPDGFKWTNHSLFMRLINPAGGASITGEGGEDMGRGGRSSLYVVDEAAFLQNAETVEKALSGNTDCVGWVSSVNGMGNLFARKRHNVLKPEQIFRLHWRDDPRKTQAWADAKQASFSDPTSWASEYDIDYSASVEGICIPAAWVESAKELLALEPGLQPSNERTAGLDVGAGKAKSVYVKRQGPIVSPPHSRGDPDTTETANWALDLAKEDGVTLLNFDSVGVGAGVASTLTRSEKKTCQVEPINVGLPPDERRVWPDGRTSDEMFGNMKAELWWLARTAFQKTHEHVRHLKGLPNGKAHPLNELIAMPKGDRESDTLNVQLSLVKWLRNEAGKIVIERKDALARRGISSPDHAEAFMLTFAGKVSRYTLAHL